MAYTALLVTVMLSTLVNAGFSSWDDDGFPQMPKRHRFASPLNFPPLPAFPGFMGVPSLPLPWPGSNFPKLPTVQDIAATIPQIALPTAQDIANQGAVPGSNFNGAAVFSHSSSVRGPDGKIQRQGGSTILTNDNGQVTVQKIGNAPPVVVSQYTNPPFPDFPDFGDAKNFKKPIFHMPTMKPFHFKIPKIPPIDPETIKKYVPGSNEQYQGTFQSVSSYSSNVNGVKTSGGNITSLKNDNGKVNEEKLGFQKGPE